ncbi:MAG: helix-hairpin-helix domain-containing protein [Bacteroidota bacterium]
MRRIKAFLRLIFGFSKTETNAFLVLLPLMLIVIVSEPVYQTYFMYNKPDNLSEQRVVDSIVAIWEKPKEIKTDSFKRSYHKRKVFLKPKARPQAKFDLNLADTTQLKSIYGIGTVIAKRIIAYRTNLGGFISDDQLYEIWGLDSTVVSRLADKSVIAPGFTPNKLAINRCSEQDLARHPYLRTKLARAIVNYRFQHGNFASIDDMKKIGIMEEKIFLRIKPYITLE